MNEPDTVAIVYNDDGTEYDRCYTWEAGQNYALHEGYTVKAVKADGHMSIADAQAIYDSELARYKDCWS